jgi:hypothetical protein
LSNGFVRDRLEVDLVEGDKFVGKEVECPASLSVWWFAAGESDEMSFGLPVDFPFIDPVGLAAMNRREPSLGVAFAGVVDGFSVTADVLTDCDISEPVICFQENPRSRVVLGLAFTGRNEPLQRFAVFIREIDNVFLRSHSGRDALRRDKLVCSQLKLHSVFEEAVGCGVEVDLVCVPSPPDESDEETAEHPARVNTVAVPSVVIYLRRVDKRLMLQTLSNRSYSICD